MKSKISFFNTNIYAKNIKLFWPVWLGYWIALMLMMPVRIWFGFRKTSDSIIIYGKMYEENYLRVLYEAMRMDVHIILIACLVIVCATCVFGYLFNARNANMIHAFPVSRLELYCTNAITGLSFMCVPQIISFIASIIVCICFGETRVVYLAVWLVMVLAITFFLYAVALVSVMCTGHIIAAVPIFAVFSFGYIVIRYTVTKVIEFFAYGVNNLSDISNGKLNWLSPLYYINYKVNINMIKDSKSDMVLGLDYTGLPVIASFFAVGIMVYIAAFMLYKRRQIECAGDFIAFDIVKPIFRWGCGCIGSMIAALAIYEVFTDSDFKIKDSFFFLMTIVLGIILFYILDMFVQKNFRVITKRRNKECVVYVGCMFLLLCCLRFTGKYIENDIPLNDEVKECYISLTYPIKIEGDKINDIVAIQKSLVNDEKYMRQVKSSYTRNVIIKYVLKNGKNVERNYTVPMTDKTIKSVFHDIYKYESDSSNLEKYLLSNNKEKCFFKATTGVISVSDTDNDTVGTRKFTAAQSQAIYEAFVKDIEDGNVLPLYVQDPEKLAMKKYNNNTYIITEDEVKGYAYWMELDFILDDYRDYTDSYIDMNGYTDETGVSKSTSERVYLSDYASVYKNVLEKNFILDENCKNVMQALIDTGVVSNIDELHKISEENE